MSYNSFVYGLFCNLYVYSFTCEFFCKFEKILMNFFSGKYVHSYNIMLPKLLDIIEVIDTTSIAKHNNTKKLVKFTTTNGENFSRKLSQIHKRSNITLVQHITVSLEVLWEVFRKTSFRKDFSEDLNFKRKI